MSGIPDAPPLDPEIVRRIERENTTIGDYERLAGIGRSREERFAFWVQFRHEDGTETIRLGMNELRRRIGLPQRPPSRPRRSR